MKVLNPKVSVIIPVYNVQKYLRECLDSVVNQTVREIEIICIDDGSTDNSGAILDEYATRDERFVVIHQENAGQSVARNRGLDLAQGEFIAFLDSDDYYEHNMLEKTLPLFEDKDIDIVSFFFQTFGENTERAHCGSIREPKSVYTGMWEKLYCIQLQIYVVWNKIYRHDFIERHALRFLEGHLYEDNHFSTKSAYYCRKLAVVPEVLYRYRIGSGCTTDDRKYTSMRQIPELYQQLVSDFRNCNLPEAYIQLHEEQYYDWLRRFYRRIISPEERPEFRKKILSMLTEKDWQQIGGKNRFLRHRCRRFFYWLAGKPILACLYFIIPFRRRDTIYTMMSSEKEETLHGGSL